MLTPEAYDRRLAFRARWVEIDVAKVAECQEILEAGLTFEQWAGSVARTSRALGVRCRARFIPGDVRRHHQR